MLNNSCLSPLNYQLDNETGTVYQLHCWDMYWIKTLHLVMLIYAQKRIHFSRPDTYKMRMQLAILDWVGETFNS